MLRTIKRFAAATISLALASVMLLSLPAWAQNLAEAARQERERRKALPPTHHVYTNEDLAKARILVPEDQALVEAHNTSQSSPVLVVAIDASHPSSPLPIPSLTTASEAPIVRRGSVALPPPPDSIYNVASFTDVLAVSPAALVFPNAGTPAPKVPDRRAGKEPQAPPDSIYAVVASVDVIASSPAQLAFPNAETSAPKVPDRRAATEPQAPSILASVENARIVATAPDVYIPFPALLAIPPGVPNEPVAAEHSPVTPPAIHPASCAGPCSELNGIISTQYSVPVFRPVAETSSIQPAIVAKPESIKPRPVVANARGTQVRVEIGDSLWKLAKRYLGDGKHWRELAALNRRLPNPGLIRPGELIQLPARVPEEARQVVVQPGDTLWTVAETAFGSPLAFNCIAHANPQLQSANVIHPGQTLFVPETCAVEPAEKDQAGAL